MKKTILNPLLAFAGCFAAFNGTSTLQAQTTNIWNFNYTGSIVQWTVPISGYYDVTAYGAQGGGWTGANRFYAGGTGGTIGGRFQFDLGEVLNILVGGTGQASENRSTQAFEVLAGPGPYLGGGGGGGSFVVGAGTNPLVVAGGGGGVSSAPIGTPPFLWNASTTASGNNAAYLNANEQGSGGSNGSGGTVGSLSNQDGGAGGGGFSGDGQSHYGTGGVASRNNMLAEGGSSYLNGGAGGNLGGFGGFGGFGGGGQGYLAGGGGGGYSGGGGGGANWLLGSGYGLNGGGGGSFLAASATNAVMTVGNTGNGSVSISAAAVSLLVDESITISSGSTTYSGIVLGSTAGDSNESFSVVNAGTIVDSANYILVGQNGSNNAMTVSGGASVADQAFTVVGLNATASGNSLLVTGTGSTWSSGGLVIGDSGTGNSVSVEAGAGVASAGSGVALGYNVGASGNSLLVDGSGSTLTSDSDLIVGFGGSFNSVVVSNGGNLTNSQSTYGGVIGLNAGSTNNSVLVTGSGSTWNNSGALTIGSAGSGVLTIADGGSVSAAEVVIAAETSAVGMLNFGSYGGGDTAGNFLPSTISFGSGEGTVNFNQTDTIAATGFSGTGSLNQRGTGTTVLTGSNSLAGTTTVSAGRLVVDGQPSLGASSVTLTGGTLELSGSFSDFSLGLAAGSMLITGTGSSWNRTSELSVGNASSGVSVIVSNGATVTGGAQVHLGPNTWATDNSILVTGSGSSWTNNATILVGATSSNNSLVVSGGGLVTAPLYVGRDAGSINNSVLVTGSGSSLSTGLGNTTVIGYSGQGTLTVANGGIATAPQGSLQIALAAGSSGILNIGGFGTNDTAGTISAPGIAFGSGTGTINFNQTNATTISADISGNGTVNQLGNGTTTLSGSNSYTGATTVSGGGLLVSGSIANSAVTVQSGGMLGGSGTVGALTVQNGGTISPGNSPGNLTVEGDLVWNGGGSYNWQVLGTTNTAGFAAGTTWDLLTVTGTLDLTALTTGSEFNINLWSLVSTGPDVSGALTGFDNTQNYTWKIATAAGGITGFNSSYFNLNTGAINGTGGFANVLGGGSFSLAQSGNDLNLVFTTAVPEPGTWAAAALLVGGAAFMRWRKRNKVS